MKPTSKFGSIHSAFRKAFDNAFPNGVKLHKSDEKEKSKVFNISKHIKKIGKEEEKLDIPKHAKKIEPAVAPIVNSAVIAVAEESKCGSDVKEGFPTAYEKWREKGREKRNHVSCPYCKSPLLMKDDMSLLRHYTKCVRYFGQ